MVKIGNNYSANSRPVISFIFKIQVPAMLISTFAARNGKSLTVRNGIELNVYKRSNTA